MERIKQTIFIPKSATVGQLYDVLYWAKDYDAFTDDEIDGVEGVVIDMVVKSEYLDDMLEAVAELGGWVLIEKDGTRHVLKVLMGDSLLAEAVRPGPIDLKSPKQNPFKGMA